MTSQSSQIKIKVFGRDKAYSTVESVKTALETDFKGQHVSIAYPKKPSGLNSVVFVSVSECGVVRHSYGEQLPVDFNEIALNLF